MQKHATDARATPVKNRAPCVMCNTMWGYPASLAYISCPDIYGPVGYSIGYQTFLTFPGRGGRSEQSRGRYGHDANMHIGVSGAPAGRVENIPLQSGCDKFTAGVTRIRCVTDRGASSRLIEQHRRAHQMIGTWKTSLLAGEDPSEPKRKTQQQR